MNRYQIKNQNNPYATHGLIIRSIGTNRCVLDVGCNEGYIGQACDRTNVFYGIDQDPTALKLARMIYKDVACVDLNHENRLPWGRIFDTIVFADILEHLIDPQRIYRSLIDHYLKSGGKIIISLPNVANWTIRLNLLFGRFAYQDTGILDRTHLHYFTYRSAREMFELEDIRAMRITGGSKVFGALIDRLPFTKSILSHTIFMELKYSE
jgi:SAM-dependent methyltransferase